LPNGDIVSGSQDRTIKVWDFRTLKCLITLEGHTSVIYSVVVLSNGNIASGSSDSTVKLWDMKRNQCIATWKHHTFGNYFNRYVYSVVSLSNGNIVSGSEDSLIKIWDIARKEESVANLKSHTDTVYSLAIRNDSTFYCRNISTFFCRNVIISASKDSTIKVWTIQYRLIDKAKNLYSDIMLRIQLFFGFGIVLSSFLIFLIIFFLPCYILCCCCNINLHLHRN
jgi:WD40 repeat protein